MCFFMFGATLKATNSYFQKRKQFCRSICEESYEAGCIHIW